MRLHSVFVTHDRLELTRQAIESYLETVSMPFSYIVVDNASSDGTLEWLTEQGHPFLALQQNRYPGYACNRGWEMAPPDATLLQRCDNDFRFLPHWCREVQRCFKTKELGQLGLRTKQEEPSAPFNVGGNCVIRRELWDAGLRYDETPWPELARGMSEDAFFSPAVVEMGYRWRRVKRPCIVNLASGDIRDPYYRRSYGDRGIIAEEEDGPEETED